MRKPDRPKSGVIFRCAIYTRKSSDDGLEQEFNSLDAQREACEAYVTSRHAGWIALPEMYDDGGLSGGTIERPALQRLLSDIKAGKAQIIVVYKIPWGVDSDQFWGQTEVANPLNLEATNASRSPLRRTDRYPNQSWRNFRLIGTQPFNLADHVAVAGRRRENSVAPAFAFMRFSSNAFDDGSRRPSDAPLAYALRSATARPNVRAVSRSKPSHT